MNPKHINHSGADFVLAGSGATRGSVVYINTRTGDHLELHEAVVIKTGALFDLATVTQNPTSLAQVRVEKSALVGKAPCATVGTRLLIGPIDYTAAHGPRALAGWPTVGAPKPVNKFAPVPVKWPASVPFVSRKPSVFRRKGIISRVAAAGSFGSIRTQDGVSFFVHQSELIPGTPLIAGAPVSFVPAFDNPRGPVAQQVKLAA